MLAEAYLWLKAFHIMAVIAWMAGLFYLSRLFVHHVEQVGENAEMRVVFEMMERKLLKVIMNPAMFAAWGFGVALVIVIGPSTALTSGWFLIKLIAIVGMTGFHIWLSGRRKALLAGTDTTSGRKYRLMNEVPTVLMVLIVIMVVVKPV